MLQEFSQGNVIIGGDFNCALSPKDKLGGTLVTRKASVIKKKKKKKKKKFNGSIFFNPENISPLTEENKTSCEGSITVDEFLEALKDFKSGKTSGTDGFPAENHRFFWTEISNKLIDSFTICL